MESSATATGMDAVLAATDTVATLMGKIWTVMTANPLLTLFLAASVLGIGIGIFNHVKKTAKK